MPVFSRKTVILDLGASRTALGVFSRSYGRLRLDDFAVETFSGHAGGAVDWLEQTRAALGVLRTRTRIGGAVVLVLPPHLTLTKLIKTPRVEAAKRGMILRFEAEQSIPYAPTDVVWDTVIAAEQETELEVLLAAAKLEAVEPLCAAVQAAGFEPGLILPSPLATLAAFRLGQDQAKEPVLILNLGARSTTLLHVEGSRFVVRTLALGGQSITQRLVENQDCDPEEAGAIKLSEHNGRLTADAVETLATRLAQEITRSVLHFRRLGGLEQPARVCLAGGGARLSGLGEALAAKLKVPVDRLDLSGRIDIGRGVAQHDAVGHALTLADLAGAAATQLRTGQPVLNLLPPSLRQQANRRRRRRLAAASLVTAAALWSLVAHLRPAPEPARAAVVIRHEPAPRPAETSTPPPAASHTAEEEETFDLELLEVKTALFPLQLAGYFGEPGDYLVAFISTDQPETLLARRGHRFVPLGLTLRSFEVRKVAVDHDDAWPVYEVAGFAVLYDGKTGAEVVLDSRRKPTGTLQAVLRGIAGHQPSTLREGELLAQGGATYRIQRIQADPPEVVLVRQAEGPAMPETRVLQPVRPASDPGEQSADPERGFGPNGH